MRLFIWLAAGVLVIWLHDRKEGKEALMYMATELLWPFLLLYYHLWARPRDRRYRKRLREEILASQGWEEG